MKIPKKFHRYKGEYALPQFFGTATEFAIENMSVDDILNRFDCDFKSFEQHFDIEKISAFLKEKAESFPTEILRRTYCPNPKCKRPMILRFHKNGAVPRKYHYCVVCRESHEIASFIGSHFPDWVLASIVSNAFQGKKPREILQSLQTEATNRYLDFDEQNKLPDEKTLYDVISKIAEKLEKFNRLMILLIGGLHCTELLIDDAFVRRTRRRHRRNVRQGGLKRFYYAIVTIDRYKKFIIDVYIASSRDESAFRVAFAKAKMMLSELPQIVKGDLLAAMIEAAEAYFPVNRVVHDFKKLKPWEKRERNVIERRIRDLRKTLRKRQKCGSLAVQRNYATIAWIGQDYVKPMEKALNNRSAAQAVGIPYPFYPWDWRKLMIWIDWVFNNVSEILRAGLK
jgi:hypothetical protein